MTVPRVKICGIQTLEEGLMCVNAGVDALGFLVGITHKAEDKVKPEKARDIIRALPLFVCKVMVTHMKEPDEVVRLARVAEVDTVQLHENMSIRSILEIRGALPYLKLIKAVHVAGSKDDCLKEALLFEPHVDAILLDSRTEDRIGGTGMVHDWDISAEIRQRLQKPLILAGGLRPDNVASAIDKVKPYAVDVNSGVEDLWGKKHSEKVWMFVRVAKHGAH